MGYGRFWPTQASSVVDLHVQRTLGVQADVIFRAHALTEAQAGVGCSVQAATLDLPVVVWRRSGYYFSFHCNGLERKTIDVSLTGRFPHPPTTTRCTSADSFRLTTTIRSAPADSFRHIPTTRSPPVDSFSVPATIRSPPADNFWLPATLGSSSVDGWRVLPTIGYAPIDSWQFPTTTRYAPIDAFRLETTIRSTPIDALRLQTTIRCAPVDSCQLPTTIRCAPADVWRVQDRQQTPQERPTSSMVIPAAR